MPQALPALVQKDLDALQAVVDRKMKSGDPNNAKASIDEVVLVAMLHIRYQDNPVGKAVLNKIQHCLTNWGIHIDECKARARQIWNSGYRPGIEVKKLAGIGSGSDVQDEA